MKKLKYIVLAALGNLTFGGVANADPALDIADLLGEYGSVSKTDLGKMTLSTQDGENDGGADF